MEVNPLKVRYIVLDDRWRRCYKPDRSVIQKIGLILPDANIHGFGFRPDLGYWAVMVASDLFPDNPFGVIRDVSIKDIPVFQKPVAEAKPWWKP